MPDGLSEVILDSMVDTGFESPELGFGRSAKVGMEGVCGVVGVVLGDGIRRGRPADMIPRSEAASRSQPSTNS